MVELKKKKICSLNFSVHIKAKLHKQLGLSYLCTNCSTVQLPDNTNDAIYLYFVGQVFCHIAAGLNAGRESNHPELC